MSTCRQDVIDIPLLQMLKPTHHFSRIHLSIVQFIYKKNDYYIQMKIKLLTIKLINA